eukprot:5433271-Lingulodinium_polyedra.AAC.1
MELRKASRGGLQELRDEVAEERRLRASEVRRLTGRLQELSPARARGRLGGLAGGDPGARG